MGRLHGYKTIYRAVVTRSKRNESYRLVGPPAYGRDAGALG